MTFEELQKKAKSVADHVEAAHAAHEKAAAHHEKMHKAHAALGEMHKEHAEHHATIAGHLAKAKEASAGMDGKAATADPPLVKTEDFVSIGKTADGVEIFKRVSPAPQVTVTSTSTYSKEEVDKLVKAATDDLLEKLKQNGATGPQPSLVVVPRAGQDVPEAVAKAAAAGDSLPGL